MVTIRAATSADVPALTAIYDYYVTHTAVSFEYETPSTGEFGARLHQVEAQQLPYLVAEAQGSIQGYAYAQPFSERKAYFPSVELTIYLDPSARRQGTGRALYHALELKLHDKGITNLYACIATPVTKPVLDHAELLNQALTTTSADPYLSWDSVRFHHHLGFRLVGVFSQCGFKFGRYYDMVYMEKLIGAHNATA